jgi:fumarylacetoacetate (FAA) hydrolase
MKDSSVSTSLRPATGVPFAGSPLPTVKTIRDFYAFEQHVKTCRAQRGLDMVPQWYEIPVFYFSNPNSVIGHGDPVVCPDNTSQLDFELELALVIGRECINLPADDSAMDVVAGFTIYNDWSARDLQRQEMAVGLGPSKGKDFANALGPSIVPLQLLKDHYKNGRLHVAMTASINGRVVSQGNGGTMYWTWPQLLAHASRNCKLVPGDVIGSGTVGGGCILELTPEVVGGWIQVGDLVRLEVEGLGALENKVVRNADSAN